MARRPRRGSSVLPLNTSRASAMRGPAGRPSTPAPSAARGTDLASALAPQQSAFGQGPMSALTPNIQAFAPEGDPGAYGGGDSYGGGGTQLIDALTAEPGPPTQIGDPGPPETPFAAATGGYPNVPGPPLYPSEQAAFDTPQSYYDTIASNMAPGDNLADIVPGYEQPLPALTLGDQYNQNKLYRLLLEGY